jgi:hypothetical protein
MDKMQHTQQNGPADEAVKRIVGRCNRGLSQYLRSKGMPLKADETFFARGGFHLAVVCRAASKLASEYDVGIGLAWDGAAISFVFNRHGLPVRLVSMKRKGAGAAWNPIDELNGAELRGRRVLVLEVDVLTGRTLRRALKELERHGPSTIDLLLERSHTFIPIFYYKELIAKGGIWRTLPPLRQAFEETERTIKRRYPTVKRVILGKETMVVEHENGVWKRGDALLADLRTNVPSGFGRILTLDDHFNFYPGARSFYGSLDAAEARVLSCDGKQRLPLEERAGALKLHYLNALDAILRNNGGAMDS